MNHSRTLSDDSTAQIFTRNFERGKTSFIDPDDTIQEENDEGLQSQSSLMQEEYKGVFVGHLEEIKEMNSEEFV